MPERSAANGELVTGDGRTPEVARVEEDDLPRDERGQAEPEAPTKAPGNTSLVNNVDPGHEVD